MQLLLLPTPSPSFSSPIALDGNTYQLELQWNRRYDRWHMSILTESAKPLASGIKLVPGANLLEGHSAEGIPPGELWAVSIDAANPDITRTTLGRTASLVYFPEAEIAAVDRAAAILRDRVKVTLA